MTSGCASEVFSSIPAAVRIWDDDVEDSFLERDFGPLELGDRDVALAKIVQDRKLKQVY